jgi:alpha-beta hydrolase superfamily lysophospholipase
MPAPTDTFAAADGTALHWHRWPRASAHGRVLIVHGLGEHAGRYAHVAAHLNAAGYDVLAFDQRGHGLSGGPRGDTPDAQARLQDVALAIDAARADRTGPLVLLGHSLGGLVAARFVAGGLESPQPAWAREVDALVLSSPALDPGMSRLQKLLLAVAGRLAPHLALGNGLDPAWISRDPAVVTAYRADPLVHDRVTATLVQFIVDGGAFAERMAPRWTTPTLLMWAGADRCVAPAGSARFAAAAPAAVVQHREFAGLFHELFNEPERAEVLALLTDWLARRLP